MEMTHNRMMNLLTSGKAADVHFLVGTGHKTEVRKYYQGGGEL